MDCELPFNSSKIRNLIEPAKFCLKIPDFFSVLLAFIKTMADTTPQNIASSSWFVEAEACIVRALREIAEDQKYVILDAADSHLAEQGYINLSFLTYQEQQGLFKRIKNTAGNLARRLMIDKNLLEMKGAPVAFWKRYEGKEDSYEALGITKGKAYEQNKIFKLLDFYQIQRRELKHQYGRCPNHYSLNLDHILAQIIQIPQKWNKKTKSWSYVSLAKHFQDYFHQRFQEKEEKKIRPFYQFVRAFHLERLLEIVNENNPRKQEKISCLATLNLNLKQYIQKLGADEFAKEINAYKDCVEIEKKLGFASVRNTDFRQILSMIQKGRGFFYRNLLIRYQAELLERSGNPYGKVNRGGESPLSSGIQEAARYAQVIQESVHMQLEHPEKINSLDLSKLYQKHVEAEIQENQALQEAVSIRKGSRKKEDEAAQKALLEFQRKLQPQEQQEWAFALEQLFDSQEEGAKPLNFKVVLQAFKNSRFYRLIQKRS